MDPIFRNASRAPRLIFAILFIESLAFLAVILRLIARRLARLALAPDDWMIIIALIIVTGIIPILVTAVRVGMGRHVATLSPSSVQTDFKLMYACQLVYYTCLTAIKSSILLLYHRLFATPRFRLAVKVVGLMVVAWWIAVAMASIFQCWPISYSWTQIPPGRCININQFSIWNAVTNIIIDSVILIMPIRIIWDLQIPQRKKVAISGIFLLGIFVTASSIVRATYLNHAFATKDPTWSFIPSEIWSAVEPCIGIVCACMPTYGPIFNALSLHLTWLSLSISSSSNTIRGTTDSKTTLYPRILNVPNANVPTTDADRNRDDFQQLTYTPESYDPLFSSDPAQCYAFRQVAKNGINSEHILVEQSFQMEENRQRGYINVRRDVESHGIRRDRI